MFRVLILILISVFCFQSQAAIVPQDTLMLSATVVDEVQEPLPYATVLLITEEGEILKSTTTDSKGVFNISKEGTDGKFIAVRFMGYKQARVSIPLPTVIQLEPNSNTLQEVIVKGKRAVYKVTEGTFEIDVSKSELKKITRSCRCSCFSSRNVGDRWKSCTYIRRHTFVYIEWSRTKIIR